jgi:hypothetical protein
MDRYIEGFKILLGSIVIFCLIVSGIKGTYRMITKFFGNLKDEREFNNLFKSSGLRRGKDYVSNFVMYRILNELPMEDDTIGLLERDEIHLLDPIRWLNLTIPEIIETGRPSLGRVVVNRFTAEMWSKKGESYFSSEINDSNKFDAESYGRCFLSKPEGEDYYRLVGITEFSKLWLFDGLKANAIEDTTQE